MRLRSKKAFTLVELITVIAVLGTLVGVSSTSYNGYREMAKKEEQKLSIQQVKNAVDNYYKTNELYPTIPLSKQPSPETEVGGVVYQGYSEIDIQMLIKERYLQESPDLQPGQFFAVHYNGLVTIEDAFSDSLIIENGEIIVAKKTDNTLSVSVHTDNTDSGRKATKVVVNEVDSTGNTIKGTASMGNRGSDGVFNGTIKVTSTPGTKYFRAKITYNDGTTVIKDASMQYAMDAESVTDQTYWVYENSEKDNVKKDVKAGIKDSDVKGNQVTIDWSDKEIESYNYLITHFKIVRTGSDGSTVTYDNIKERKFVDTAVQGGVTYRYKITAYSNSMPTVNVLYDDVTTKSYQDTLAYFFNVTKNDYQASLAETIMFNVGDKEGIKSVKLHIGTVVDGELVPTKTGAKYTTYILGENNRRYAETRTIRDAYGNDVPIDVYTYSFPVEVADDYIVYWVEIEDMNTYKTYCYYNPDRKQASNETAEEAEEKRTVIVKGTSANHPGTNKDKNWCIMRGLVKIHEDSFIDDSKIDNANSNYKLYDGKVYLP